MTHDGINVHEDRREVEIDSSGASAATHIDPHSICVMGARSSRASPGVLCSRRSQLSDSIMVQQYIFNSLGTPHYHSNTYDDVYPWPRGLGMGGGGAAITFDSHI